MIKLLTDEEKEKLFPIFLSEFSSLIPEQSNIVAIEEDGEVVAFVLSEVLIRVGLLYVKPELRGTQRSASLSKRLIRYLFQRIPKNSSVITIASESKYNSLFEKIGMREEAGTVYRLDL
jgi:hypothetical protein